MKSFALGLALKGLLKGYQNHVINQFSATNKTSTYPQGVGFPLLEGVVVGLAWVPLALHQEHLPLVQDQTLVVGTAAGHLRK